MSKIQHKCQYCVFCGELACSACDKSILYDFLQNATLNPVNKAAQFKFSGYDAPVDFPFEINHISEYNVRISHPFFNCDQLNVATLARILCSAERDSIDFDQRMLKILMPILSNMYLKNDFILKDILPYTSANNFDGGVNIRVYDSRKAHLLSLEVLFGHLENLEVFVSDIHDAAQHAAQMMLWCDFVKKLGIFGKRAFVDGDEFDKQIATFLLYACLEYSVVCGERNPYSFGCLNWQSPRKSPVVVSQYEPVCGGCISSWNSVRALSSMVRRQKEISQYFGLDCDWLNDLGYKVPSHITLVSEMRGFKVDEQIPVFTGPDSAEELFSNALKIMDSHS